jgi:hypothetical protein
MYLPYILDCIQLFAYLFVFLIAVYIILSGTIRIRMHFWQTQPVFHIYNLGYWLNPPGTINKEPPPVNKFVNLSNNKLLKVPIDTSTEMPNETKKEKTEITDICKFIKDNYVIHDSTSYKPSEKDILAYLQCANQPAFFNVYEETKLPFMTETKILGVTSARLLNVMLKKKKQFLSFPVYYIDNLCVNPDYRKKGIAPEMIQTFYYNISRANPKVNAYLFKREGQLNAIVPLVCYDTYAFDMSRFHTDILLTAAMTIIDIGAQQLNLFIAFVKEQTLNFGCVILPDVSNVLHLIKLGQIKIYGILFNGELHAVYIFRMLNLYYGVQKAAECITILSNCQSTDILTAGFAMSWANIKCDILIIEDTAHSKSVITALDKNSTVVRNFKSPTAFFLYNYAAYSVKNTKALLFY